MEQRNSENAALTDGRLLCDDEGSSALSFKKRKLSEPDDDSISGPPVNKKSSSFVKGADPSAIVCFNNIHTFDDVSLDDDSIGESGLSAGNASVDDAGLAFDKDGRDLIDSANQNQPSTSAKPDFNIISDNNYLITDGGGLSAMGKQLLSDDSSLVFGLTPHQLAACREIVTVLPDIDPHFVVERCLEAGDVGAFEFANELALEKDYPKLRDRVQPETKRQTDFQLFENGRFSFRKLLALYPNPEIYFMDTALRQRPSQDYITQSRGLLIEQFPALKLMAIDEMLAKHEMLYLPTVKALEGVYGHHVPLFDDEKKFVSSKWFLPGQELPPGVTVDSLSKFRRSQPGYREPALLPTDKMLFWEYGFYLGKKRSLEMKLRERAKLRQERVAAAQTAGELVECKCCYLDDCLPEDMVFCVDFVHSFCKECVKNHTNACFEEGKCHITCIEDGCQSVYEAPVLARLVKPDMMSALLRRTAQQEVKQAGLQDLEACPFCDFMVIMPNAEDKILKCLNAKCSRQSCRLCKKPEHVPFKCGELDATETGLRTFVENRMADALMRTCPDCNNRLIKEAGCNRVQCPCGVQICYHCNAKLSQDNPYAHFNVAESKCPLSSQDFDLHDKRAISAGEDAIQEFMDKHPGLRETMKDQLATLSVESLVGVAGKRGKGKAHR